MKLITKLFVNSKNGQATLVLPKKCLANNMDIKKLSNMNKRSINIKISDKELRFKGKTLPK